MATLITKRDHLEHAHTEDELVDLDGDQRHGGEQRQVLGPPLGEPQPHHLGGLERGIGGHQPVPAG